MLLTRATFGDPTDEAGGATTMTGEGHLVLIVEDDADNAALLAEVLASRGDRARVAGTVEEGLKALAEEEPCYCLIDQQLPTDARGRPFVGGGQRMMVAARRRNNRRTGDHHVMPIVVVTGYAMDPDFVSQMFELGADAFVAKPLLEPTIEKLLGKIRVVLAHAGRADHADCEGCRAPAKTNEPAAQIAPVASAPRIVIDGGKGGSRAHVFVNGARREVQEAVFLVLVRLVAAHVRAPGSWTPRAMLGVATNRSASSRVRDVFAGLAPPGFEVLENDRRGSFRLNPAVVVERVAWDVLCEHTDGRIQRVARERLGRG